MNIFKIGDKFEIVSGSKAAEPKYRKEISALTIERFGKGPFSAVIMKEILIFCQQYYSREFEKVCRNETSYAFYTIR